MEFMDGAMRDIQIAYIGGGSRGWAWTFMTDLALEKDLAGTVRLYDIDRAAAEANAAIGNRLKGRTDAVGKWDYRVCGSLGEALSGADFVILSILPKTFDEMEVDVHLPERLGIYQSVGDSTGPGGMIRALRTLPLYLEFAGAIKEYCPQAWVINYTNPMSLCVKALYTAFPGIKAFGCCHEVFGTQKMLAGIAARELGVGEPDRREIHVNVLGINHFTWFDRASWLGRDLFPLYRRYIEKHFREGFVEDNEKGLAPCFLCVHRVKMDLFNRYGLIAAAGDRHLAEFMPGETYLRDPETVDTWGFALTPVRWRKEDLRMRLAKSRRLAGGEEKLRLEPTGEEGIRLIKALCGLDRVVSNVNIPNTNRQIANLPNTAVVETNALFERDALRPVAAGSLPENVRALILPHVENHERIMEVVLGGNRDAELVTEAFLHDPLVRGRAGRRQVEALVRDMMAATL